MYRFFRGSFSCRSSTTSERPNFLFVIMDDMAPEATTQVEEMKRLLDETTEKYKFEEPPYKYESPAQLITL